jgi:geranylgeranyl diphosphate synthase type II
MMPPNPAARETTHLEQRIAALRSRINACLETLLPGDDQPPSILHRAMRYAVLSPGKRLRPILCLLAADLFRNENESLLRPSCSLELLHAYTLVHDDLPCMDDDDLRRGRPTLHKVFPENIALLAGDALLTLAFSVIAEQGAEYPDRAIRAVADLARLTGSTSLIGGQVLDLQSENKTVTPGELESIHRNKTAKLLQASVRQGAILSGAPEPALESLSCFGMHCGMAFQISDDLLDETGDAAKMGKNTGQDRKLKKATYPALFGLERSREMLASHIESALASLKPFGARARPLIELARFLADREN